MEEAKLIEFCLKQNIEISPDDCKRCWIDGKSGYAVAALCRNHNILFRNEREKNKGGIVV